jgi:hypothetical protein
MSSLVKLRILRPFTSQSSFATWEIKPVEVFQYELPIWQLTRRTEIVRYDNDTAFVFLDCPCESIDGGHIQVISRLICEWRSADVIH